MAWYLNANGETVGPVDEARLIEWIHGRHVLSGTICSVGSQQWMDLAAHPPFAAALRQAAPPPPPLAMHAAAHVNAQGYSPARAKTPMNPWLKLSLIGMALVVVGFSVGVVGVLLGLALVGTGEFARRNNRTSFVSWVVKRQPTAGLAIGSIALGAVILLGGVAQIVGAMSAKWTAEREQQARLAADATRKADLTASLPTRVAEWRAKIGQVRALAESPIFVGGGLGTIDAVTSGIDAFAADVGPPPPPSLGQVKMEAAAVRDKYAARSNFEDAVRETGEQIQAAKDQVAAKKWLAADLSYAGALARLDAIAKAPAWLTPLLPVDFEREAKQKQIETLRAQIAGPVAIEQRKQENEARLARIESIKGSANSDDRSSYTRAKAQLLDEQKACGRCPAAGAITTAVREIDSTLQDWPVDLASIEEMKNRYADLRGHHVRVKGSLSVSTYYNCRYASQSEWRSFELSDTLLGGVHVYCSRGDDGCEAIFQRLASGGREKGSAVVKYPSYNEVCSESQAQLLGWK